MKIDVIGGGPGGLFFAMVAKTRMPSLDVTVHERNPENATYGFGIALQQSSWEFISAANRECMQDILATSIPIPAQVITHKGTPIEISAAAPGAGVARMALLQVLRKHALAAGAKVVHADAVTDPARLADSDLVVGADGVNSMVRLSDDAGFGVSSHLLTSRMAWYGANQRFPNSRLTFRKTPYGYFWSVCYPHAQGHSTFVAECEERAWHASGLGEMDMEEQLRFSASIFEPELQGATLLSNNSTWKALPVTRVRHWHASNKVLLGDALHSPHPSIGSGTRLSMDDAAALAEALCNHPTDVGAALVTYRELREPIKMKLVVPMERSLEWYETIGNRLDDMTPLEVVYDYMSRTGRMSLERLEKTAPEFYRRYGEQMENIAAARAIA